VYKAKIIPPNRKNESFIRDLLPFSGWFSSVTDLKVKILDRFGTTTSNVGYFEDRQWKMWICCQENLNKIYASSESAKKKDMWLDLRKQEKHSILLHFYNVRTQMYVLAKFQFCILKAFEVTVLQNSSYRKINLYSKYRENKLLAHTKTQM